MKIPITSLTANRHFHLSQTPQAECKR